MTKAQRLELGSMILTAAFLANETHFWMGVLWAALFLISAHYFAKD
jgi:hypothetical protein